MTRRARGTRTEAIHGLNAAVEEFARSVPDLSGVAASGREWGTHEVLCHLVFWHETYAAIAAAINSHAPPPVAVGKFPALNRLAVERLERVSDRRLVERLGDANRRLSSELAKLAPAARIRIKVGAKARGPVDFARRIEGHFRGHLGGLKHLRRLRTASSPRAQRPLAHGLPKGSIQV